MTATRNPANFCPAQFKAVDVVQQQRIVTASIDGATYQIPEAWIMGFCRGDKMPEDAVAYWHEQELMAARFQNNLGFTQRIAPHKMTVLQLATFATRKHGVVGAERYLRALVVKAGCANYGRKYEKALALVLANVPN